MATKLEHRQLESSHFKNFIDHIPGSQAWDPNTVEAQLELGGLQVSTFFEHAVANANGNCTVISEDQSDLSNGVDCKMATVSNNGGYSAMVKSIEGKTGGLVVQVYERIQDKFYYFTIPRSAYEHLVENKLPKILIPFESNGTPRRTPKGPVNVNWWDFEVKTFQEMAKFNG